MLRLMPRCPAPCPPSTADASRRGFGGHAAQERRFAHPTKIVAQAAMLDAEHVLRALERYRDGPPKNPRSYPDLHEHVLALERAGLLVVVDEPINKDTEMHPLV